MPQKAARTMTIGRRKRAGSILTGLGLLIAALWLWSGWHTLAMPIAGKSLWLGRGSMGVSEFLFSGQVGEILFDAKPSGLSWAANHGPLWWQDGSVTIDPTPSFPVLPVEHDLGALLLWKDVDGWNFCFALWPIAALMLIAGGLLFRSGSRARTRAATNRCADCGYSLAGLTTGSSCPECGATRLPGA